MWAPDVITILEREGFLRIQQVFFSYGMEKDAIASSDITKAPIVA